MNKLAVIFPGIGYTPDKPLLYYSRKIAAGHGYEIMIMDYKGFPPKIVGDRGRMEESCRIALEQAEEKLAAVDLTSYDDILFIGKSIGTIVAAKIASESPARSKVRQIMYTPLEAAFTLMTDSVGAGPIDEGQRAGSDSIEGQMADNDRAAWRHGKAIAFTGAMDQWTGKENSPIAGLCEERGIPYLLIPNANHSLESRDAFADMKELYRIMEETEAFILG